LLLAGEEGEGERGGPFGEEIMRSPLRCTVSVFPGLVPGIHVFATVPAVSWVTGTSPAMTSLM
jgi:hypothetical protein